MAWLLIALAACDPGVVAVDAVQHGADLYAGIVPASPSKLNLYACKTCHPLHSSAAPVPGQVASAPILPGAPLAGVTQRGRWWGGAEADLLRAVNVCRARFQHAPAPWAATDVEARALWAFLVHLPADVTTVWPFTAVQAALDLPPGDGTRGAQVYDVACRSCHGAAHTGLGRLATRVPRLPEQAVLDHAGYSPALLRVVFVEKVRHGGFFGYGGDMPPYSREVLSDADLAALLTWFGLYDTL